MHQSHGEEFRDQPRPAGTGNEDAGRLVQQFRKLFIIGRIGSLKDTGNLIYDKLLMHMKSW
jgi:hypothetical protein